jgi:hypothetical protein
MGDKYLAQAERFVTRPLGRIRRRRASVSGRLQSHRFHP